jgi:hypothetical protein
MNKKFKDTKVGQFINKVAPDVIDTVGNIFPAVNVLKALIPQDGLSPEQNDEFNTALQEYELNELQEYLKDVQNARNMNIEIQKASEASKLAKDAAYYLDFIIVGATIALGLLLFFRAIPVGNKEIAYLMFGSLLTLCGTVVNFHRGSTHGSSKKTDMLFKKLQ